MLVRLSYGHSYEIIQVLQKLNWVCKTTIIYMHNIKKKNNHKLFSFL